MNSNNNEREFLAAIRAAFIKDAIDSARVQQYLEERKARAADVAALCDTLESTGLLQGLDDDIKCSHEELQRQIKALRLDVRMLQETVAALLPHKAVTTEAK